MKHLVPVLVVLLLVSTSFVGVSFDIEKSSASFSQITLYEGESRTMKYPKTQDCHDIYYSRGFKIKGMGKDNQIEINDAESKIIEPFRNNIYQNDIQLITIVSGVIYVPDDYQTIQSAVDNASVGDEIIVRNGTYNENVIVDKPLIIHSEYGYKNCTAKHDNISRPIFQLTSDSITIKGFKFEGRPYTEPRQVGLHLKTVKYCQILENYFFEEGYCIKVTSSHNNYIFNNLIGNFWTCQYFGIWMSSSNNNSIFNNTVKECHGAGWGIHIENSDNNHVYNNNINNNNYGIICESSKNNLIINNIVKSNFHGGINLYESTNNSIKNNNISKTFWDGIYLSTSDNNNIENNTLSKNGLFVFFSYNNNVVNNVVNGKPLVYIEETIDMMVNEPAGQIILVNCENISIENQEISNVEVGIEFWNTSNSTISDSYVYSNVFEAIFLAYSNYNNIKNCTLEESWNGIALYYSEYNCIGSNTLHLNGWEGIFIMKSHSNIILGNKISKNYDGLTLESSKYNKIYYNEIFKTKSNFDGLRLESSSYNNISYNDIHNNYVGIHLITNCKGNNIFHNNFSSNSEYKSCGGNNWDNGYPSGGNYWDDYTGEDHYRYPSQTLPGSDGIGDVPYIFSGGKKVKYPLMEPFGNFRVNTNGPYFNMTNIQIQFNGFACSGSPPYTWHWTFGDVYTSDEQNPIYTFANPGKYDVILTVTDNESYTVIETTYALIQATNTAPDKPAIDGPTKGSVKEEHDYCFSGIEPDTSVIYLYVDWGDNSSTGWIGPYESGQQIVSSHKWSQEGTFTIKAKVKDIFGEESDWAYLEVTMPHSYNNPFWWLNGLLDRLPLLQRLLEIIWHPAKEPYDI